jgi:hypothetical protein
VRRPVKALQTIASDPTLRARVRLKGAADMSAIAIQRWYASRAQEFLARQQVNSMESRDILTLWRSTLAALESDHDALFGKLDWVTKRALLDGAGPLSQAAQKKIDIKYHELGGGYLSLLEQKGLAPVLTSESQIAVAVRHQKTSRLTELQFLLNLISADDPANVYAGELELLLKRFSAGAERAEDFIASHPRIDS